MFFYLVGDVDQRVITLIIVVVTIVVHAYILPSRILYENVY